VDGTPIYRLRQLVTGELTIASTLKQQPRTATVLLLRCEPWNARTSPEEEQRCDVLLSSLRRSGLSSLDCNDTTVIFFFLSAKRRLCIGNTMEGSAPFGGESTKLLAESGIVLLSKYLFLFFFFLFFIPKSCPLFSGIKMSPFLRVLFSRFAMFFGVGRKFSFSAFIFSLLRFLSC